MAVILPAVVIAEPGARTGVALSALFGDYTGAGIRITPGFTEAIASSSSYIMSGGAKASGYAVIALDPWIMTMDGGAVAGGAATVTAIQITITQVVMQGGAKAGGSAIVTYEWKEMAGSGGAKAGGTAVVSDYTPVKLDLIASGGAKAGGSAVVASHTLLSYQQDMAGGAKAGGSAVIDSVSVLQFTHTPTGGAAGSGSAIVDAIAVLHFVQSMSGGAKASGTATVAVNWTETAMSGGSKAGGSADVGYYQRLADGWALNLNTGAASQYEQFKFNSFCRIGANYYGLNDSGIFLLSGGTDNGQPINATITTGISDLSTEQFDGSYIKSMASAYCNAMSAAPMTLTCNVEGQSYTYTFSAATSVVKPARVDIGRGLFGVNWQFEVKNVGGADFELDSLTFTPNSTKRRV